LLRIQSYVGYYRAVLQNLDMGRIDEAIVLQRSAIDECELVLSLL
jgi:hypothetical protein